MPTAEKFSIQAVALGATMISFSGVYVKWAHVSPTVSAFYRVFIGGLILMTLTLLRREPFWLNARYFKLQILCGFIFSLDLFAYHKSIVYTGPGLATILANFQVVFIAIVGVALLREKLNAKLLAAVPLGLVGLFLVVGIQWDTLPATYRQGVVLGLLTAVFYTGYILSLRQLQSLPKKLPPISNLATVSFSTAFFLAIFSGLERQTFGIADLETFGALTAYALFSQVLGWIFISRGLPGMRASLAGLLLLLQPTLAFVWDMLLFDLPVTVGSGIGTVLTLAAIYLGGTSRASNS